MSKILAPSEINFLIENGDGNNIQPDTNVLTDLSRQFIEKRTVPKLQVSEKNGSWFALNNTSLHVVKELERQGKCSSVQVEIVPLSKVPISLQNGMLTASGQSGEKETAFSECCPPKDLIEQGVSRELKGERRGFRRLQIEENFGIESNETGKYGSHDSYDDAEDSGESSPSEASDYEQDSDESDGEDSLVCNVCDRAFSNGQKLGRHQMHRKHFCCSVCDALFPTLMVLQIHKKTLEHWTDDEADNEVTNEFDEDDEEPNDQNRDLPSGTFRQPYEEIERLL